MRVLNQRKKLLCICFALMLSCANPSCLHALSLSSGLYHRRRWLSLIRCHRHHDLTPSFPFYSLLLLSKIAFVGALTVPSLPTQYIVVAYKSLVATSIPSYTQFLSLHLPNLIKVNASPSLARIQIP